MASDEIVKNVATALGLEPDDLPENLIEKTIPTMVTDMGLDPADLLGLRDLDVGLAADRSKLVSSPWRGERTHIARRLKEEFGDEGGALVFALMQASRGSLDAYADLPDPRRNDACSFVQEAGPWLVSGTLGRVAGRLVVTSLTVEPNSSATEGIDPDGVTSTVLRSIRLGDLVTRVRTAMRLSPDLAVAVAGMENLRPSDFDVEVAAQLAAGVADPAPSPTSPNRKPDSFYAAIADQFLQEQERGPGVYARLEQLHAPRPAATIRSWVTTAERRGYLTPGTQGRQDRQPGPRLIELYNQRKEEA
jgi:hypothetical protein